MLTSDPLICINVHSSVIDHVVLGNGFWLKVFHTSTEVRSHLPSKDYDPGNVCTNCFICDHSLLVTRDSFLSYLALCLWVKDSHRTNKWRGSCSRKDTRDEGRTTEVRIIVFENVDECQPTDDVVKPMTDLRETRTRNSHQKLAWETCTK